MSDEQTFTLPEAHTSNAAFEGMDSLDKLAQGFADTHKAHSELNQTHSDMVASQPIIPENAEAYDIKSPEGYEANESLTANFKGWMHEAGVTNENAQALSDKFNSWAIETQKAAEVEAGIKETAQVDGLKKEWGSEFDGKTKIANDGLQRFYTEAKIDAEAQTAFAAKFGNDPVAIKLFHAIGLKIGESPQFDADGKPLSAKGPGRTEGGTPMLHDYSKTMT